MNNIDSASTFSEQKNKSTDNISGIDKRLFAAIDLGSNSFHIVKSRYEREEFVVVDRHKVTVRLAAGLDEQGSLSDEARGRALTTLCQFSQLLRDVPKENVRAVGTCLLYTSPSPRDRTRSRMPSSA